MGLVSEISALMRKGPELMSQANGLKLNKKTVASGAKDSTFQFPCAVVDTAPIDMANTVVRQLEQLYASYTQTWLSMNSMFDITIDPTPLSYLKRLHQNFKLENVGDLPSIEEGELSSYMEKVYDGSYRLYMNEDKTFGVLFNQADHATKEMMESHKELLKEHMSDFNLSPIESIMEADDNTEKSDLYDLTSAIIDGKADSDEKNQRDTIMRQTDRNQAPKLLDRDVKKTNDMVPYGIQVRLIAINDKKEFVQYIDFIVGVKAILHPVSSEDMIENIVRALQNKSVSFKFIRWTTGEISLVKDIILNLNDIKTDAMNKQSNKSPFFGKLKRLKDRKIGIRNLTVPHALIPNTTFVLTSYEVDYLKNHYGIDLTKVSIAKKLMDSLFLMGIVLLDEGSGTVSIIYDEDDMYQTYALETLERDNAMNSNKLGREIGRMISR